jgi:hypothetical protein
MAGELFHDLAGVAALLRGSAELAQDEVGRGTRRCGRGALRDRARTLSRAHGGGRLRGDAWGTSGRGGSLRAGSGGGGGDQPLDAACREPVHLPATIARPRGVGRRALDLLQPGRAEPPRQRRSPRAEPGRDPAGTGKGRAGGVGHRLGRGRWPGEWIGTSALVSSPLFAHGGHGGTGFGLSFVRWAAERLGGRVSYERGCRLDGACFVLRVPAAPPHVRPRHTAAAPPGSLRGVGVVVVDDDERLLTLYRRIFERFGADVHRAAGDGG